MIDTRTDAGAAAFFVAVRDFGQAFDRIPGQGPVRGPSVNDEFDYCDDFDRLGMREVESGKQRRAE